MALQSVRIYQKLFPLFIILIAFLHTPSAFSLQLDWNGQFWTDLHTVNNYQLDRTRPGTDRDPIFVDSGELYVPSEGNGAPYPHGTGEKHSFWYSAFLRLNPRVVVNDAIQIKSELHVGSPIYGFFGRGFPDSGDERLNFTGSNKNGMLISAQRYWANLVTDFGTFEAGRAPLHWGLGAIWNSGDKLYDHYQSTGDMFRLTSKFGSFYILPSFVKIATGNNVSGANVGGMPAQGNDDVTDYNLAAKYDNTEEDFEFGLMWTRRTGNSSQKSIFFNGPKTGSTRINYNLFDFYAQKRWSRFSLGGEVPFFTGFIGSANQLSNSEFDYKALAVVLESKYNSDVWDVDLKLGHVPGQPPSSVTDTRYRAVYLHKNYGLGLIMFRYNLYGLYNNNPDTVPAGSLNSPYDAGIVNANYLALTPSAKIDKWTFKTAFIMAYADTTAQEGRLFYNYNSRKFYMARGNQGDFLGWEWDLGAAFQWDENFVISADAGAWFPGSYYEFTNHPVLKKFETSFMFAGEVKAGITF